MMNDAEYRIDSPEMDRLVEYNLILVWLETFKEQCLISFGEYSKAIKETNRLYADVRG